IIENKDYVSRGGLKLEHALHTWNIDVKDLDFVDAGSSTGGFSDCLLQHGAHKVHAVDVGYNQLDYRLRVDPRIIVHEKTNIMHLARTDIEVDAAVADLSFRSITKAASHILSLTRQSWMISLIKPQFEIEGAREDFTGVIDDPFLLINTLINVYNSLTDEQVGIKAIIESPIQGRKGNREFLAWLTLSQGFAKNQFIKEIHHLIKTS
ncbi:MAG: TlyA family RNA methyltransferase, partial [Spirochaetia bacterium]|nr:TlyA family RNA methyltransferase [Spirochaetia bacterium]